jgi:hypothetical protein
LVKFARIALNHVLTKITFYTINLAKQQNPLINTNILQSLY